MNTLASKRKREKKRDETGMWGVGDCFKFPFYEYIGQKKKI